MGNKFTPADLAANPALEAQVRGRQGTRRKGPSLARLARIARQRPSPEALRAARKAKRLVWLKMKAEERDLLLAAREATRKARLKLGKPAHPTVGERKRRRQAALRPCGPSAKQQRIAALQRELAHAERRANRTGRILKRWSSVAFAKAHKPEAVAKYLAKADALMTLRIAQLEQAQRRVEKARAA